MPFISDRPWRLWSGRLAAELAIVVLGVTIALWADGWVAERGERREETARLQALTDNVTETLAAIRKEQKNARGAARAGAATTAGQQDDDFRLFSDLLHGHHAVKLNAKRGDEFFRKIRLT